MSKEVAIREQIELMDKFATLWLTGERNPTVLARQLGIKRSDALTVIDEYKSIIHNDPEVKARAAEALYEADNSINLLVKEMWATIEQVDSMQDFKTKATLLKNAADTEIKRVEMLQKAGLYEDAALGDEMAEMEERQSILEGIIREVSAHCDNCKVEVARRLSKLSGKAEPIVVEEQP